MTRRQMLQRSMLGFGSIALLDLLSRRSGAAQAAALAAAPNPLALKPAHIQPLAKRVIYIFLEGGVSQVDSYDYKPLLQEHDGKPLPASIQTPRFAFAPTGTLLKSPFAFKQWGQCGKWASDLFPQVNELMDDLCFLHALHHDNEDHNTAKTMIHTGVGRELRPTLGSWLVYGLGTENDNLPGYIDIVPDAPKSRPAAFLPAHFAGTPIGRPDKTEAGRTWENLDNGNWPGQRRHLDLIQDMNRAYFEHAGSDLALEAEIQNMEMAFRMQTEAPAAMSLEDESKVTKELYGIGAQHTDDFGRALLMARRFAERGVRYITVTHATRKYGNLWDQHEHLEEGHRGNARSVDKPIAGLLRDLKSRGMLDDTLVMCGSEFGRTPVFEFKDGGMGRLRNGRNHNPHGFTMWLAGGGTKNGFSYGRTDDFGFYAVADKMHVHDLHATILHIMGLDHTRLTFRHGGRDFRLTDVFGTVGRDILTAG